MLQSSFNNLSPSIIHQPWFNKIFLYESLNTFHIFKGNKVVRLSTLDCIAQARSPNQMFIHLPINNYNLYTLKQERLLCLKNYVTLPYLSSVLLQN